MRCSEATAGVTLARRASSFCTCICRVRVSLEIRVRARVRVSSPALAQCSAPPDAAVHPEARLLLTRVRVRVSVHSERSQWR